MDLWAWHLAPVPVVLIALGSFDLTRFHGVASSDVLLAVGAGALATGLGIARGATTELFEYDGYLWLKYDRVTLLLWALFVCVQVALVAIANMAHFSLEGTQTLPLGLGLSLLGEAVAVGIRSVAKRIPSAPFPRQSRGYANYAGRADLVYRLSAPRPRSSAAGGARRGSATYRTGAKKPLTSLGQT